MKAIARALICVAGLGFCFLFEDVGVRDAASAEPAADPKVIHAAALAELSAQLQKSGFAIEQYLSHPSFCIHENIAASFKKSAETTGYVNYQKKSRAVSDSAKAAAFDTELTAYKKKLGYADKQRSISRFIRENSDQLTLCEQKYNIPKEVVAAVIGMESTYGKVTGRYFAFNVYVSMYVCGYRKEFALSELQELLKFAKKKQLDIFTLRSSYGGAMGNMQFIPSSLNRWFVGDGTDLTDMDDTIASVSNYLGHFYKLNGTIEKAVYQYNQSTFYTRAVLDLADYATTTTIADR